MSGGPAIFWARDDLRLADNPALDAACRQGPAVVVHVLEEGGELRPLGAASRWWLHHSLLAFSADIERRGGRLVLRRGDPRAIIPMLADELGAGLVSWNRRTAGAARAVDAAVKTRLATAGRRAQSFNGNLLADPVTFRSKAGTPFEVFTPFWRALAPTLDLLPPPLPAPQHLAAPAIAGDDLAAWRLLPVAPDWAAGFAPYWRPGEAGAVAALDRFVGTGDSAPLARYKDGRDYPAADATSRLSPHLRFGEISPLAVLQRIRAAAAPTESKAKFLAELGWREFCHHLLAARGDLATANVNPAFDAMPWRDDPAALTAWQHGRTGIPIVDAGMRELWRTGTMHNRVRMVAASFLCKHLLIDWRAGERWFWDTLVDADIANNPAGWQWVAGSGADAAPYFRVFNPVLQGEKFDPDGTYVRRHLPELALLPDEWLMKPFAAPPEVLARAGVRLGVTYPHPLVEPGAGRARALAAYARLRAG